MTQMNASLESNIIDRVYSSIAVPETGGEANPWIRTKHRPEGGSTAFGPVQITGSLLKSYLKKGLLSPESSKFASEIMLPMYDNFAKYGAEPKKQGYRKEYDYGGSGLFDPELYGQAYENMAKEMMAIELKRNGGDINKFIESWRGKKESEDKRYYAEFRRIFNSINGIGPLKK